MAAPTDIDRGRADLIAWRAAQPENYFESDSNLQSVLRMHLGDAYPAVREQLSACGAASARQMDALARESNEDENLPRLSRYDDMGTRTEEVVFHPSYHSLGKLFWRTGVLSVLGEPAQETFSGALGYFLAHHGEAGHSCPLACTAGLIKLLQRLGTTDQKQRYLPRLLDSDYQSRLHASQFVTEIQGGSDVGSNACVARPDPDRPGWYRISGEKWFCSVIDAGVFAVSARVEGDDGQPAPGGTKGLGIFIVPRQVDDEPNGFSVRRLKTKLGTRSMASAETDFEGALAEPIGPLDRGFKNLVSIVLDTSRMQNALAACGMMRRAYIEAQTFAARRRAFGVPIIEHPMVQQVLARMHLETATAVATTFRLLAMTDRIARGEGSGDLERARRVFVNINKYWTAIRCTQAIRDGIEILGGNGAIEDFSVLPRLYRDSIVIESWEGTHNTLCAQVLRDFATRGLHRFFCAELRATIGRVEDPSLVEQRELAERLQGELEERTGRLLSSGATEASLHIRSVVDRMCKLEGYVSLLAELAWEREQDEAAAAYKSDIVELYRLQVLEGADPMDTPQMAGLFGRLSSRL